MEHDVMAAFQKMVQNRHHIIQCQLLPEEFPQDQTPPTMMFTNDVIAPFQEIVNTYAISRYQEINPAAFYVATFPFLFGVMFGDLAHGSIILYLGNPPPAYLIHLYHFFAYT